MIGKTISHYKILEKLGEGGKGVVYKAQDTKLKRMVALKFLLSHALGSDEEKTRFVHEAQAASALDHPNIGTIYEVDETGDGQMFIVMANYEGETVKAKIERGSMAIDKGRTRDAAKSNIHFAIVSVWPICRRYGLRDRNSFQVPLSCPEVIFLAWGAGCLNLS